MRFSEERLTPELIFEIEPFSLLHREEIGGHIPDIDWGRYQTLDFNRSLKIYTARDGDKLIGYASFILDNYIHDRDMLVARNTAIYVSPDCRKKNTGIKFMQYSIDALFGFGVQRVYMSVKPKRDYSKSLERLGFKLEETVYSRDN